MSAQSRAAICIWMIAMVSCVLLIERTGLSTDMAAFLPRSPSAAQRVLVDQVRNGIVSRLILLGVEGSPAQTLAAVSRAIAFRLRGEHAFLEVNNGEEVAFAQERDVLWQNRYLLSPSVVPDRFTVTGLRNALEKDLQLLRSEFAPVAKHNLPNDPTGEVFKLIGEFAGPERPHARDGVWFSRDERRAILVAQTRAPGFDIDAQQQALALIHDAFDRAKREVPGANQARILETGPGVFAVRTRSSMERDATRFSLLATTLVAGLLFFAYRSLRLLLLGLLPVLSGAIAGIAAVALGFGFVHGITLGFGVTLIGESVDYAIYLFTQTAPGSSPDDTLSRIWTTLRLGVVTSIAGYSTMLFSSFAGFAQLGLFSIAGLVAAVSVTRWVLPALLPSRFATVKANVLALPLLVVIRHARRLRTASALMTLLAIGLLYFHRGGFMQEDLSSLSPIPAADQKIDQELRRDVGAPDLRYLILLTSADEQQALTESERVSRLLEGLLARHILQGFDAPDRYLPSARTQAARQSALPSAETLRKRLREALVGFPFRSDLFAPFVDDVAAAKSAPILTRDRLSPNLSLKVDSLLFRSSREWIAVLPLRGVSDLQSIADAIAGLNTPSIAFVDLQRESDRLLQVYQHEAMMLALIGGVVVIVLLSVSLRSPRRLFVVVAPLVIAVIFTTALLTAGGQRLSIFNIVGLLLIVAVGSNYCLFFERQSGSDPAHRSRSVASLVLANLCTVIGFGLLSLSGIPVLHDIGMTVAIGTFLSLLFSAILSANHVYQRPPSVDGMDEATGILERCALALRASMGLAGRTTVTVDTGPTWAAEQLYTSLYPYYAELCAVSQLKKKTGFGVDVSSGVGGHSVFYLNGVCRDDSSHYPTIRLCENNASAGQHGVGISVNAHYKNANWSATEGRDFFFHGTLTPGEPLTRAAYEQTQARAKDMQILDGIEFHSSVLERAPPGMSRRDYMYEVSVATDYAIGFGRDRYCARVPMDRERMALIVEFLNALNAPYRDGRKKFEWNVLRNNCSHVAHNALAAAGVWDTWVTDRFVLLAAFDFPVPKNVFVNLTRRTNDMPIHDLQAVYKDEAARRALMRTNSLPTAPGALVQAEPAFRDNELYDTNLSLIFYDDPIFGPYHRHFHRIFGDARYLDLRANLQYFANLYLRIARERRPLVSFLASYGWGTQAERDHLESFYARFYAYADGQSAKVAAALASLPPAPFGLTKAPRQEDILFDLP